MNHHWNLLDDLSLGMAVTALTLKDTPFVWSKECKKAIEELKESFTTAPILRHFDPDRPIVVETDASDFLSGGVLSQPDEEDVLHPVVNFSKKHSPAVCNHQNLRQGVIGHCPHL